MTAQFSDLFLFNQTKYSVAGIHGELPFVPENFGLDPIGTCSACWRGYVATFAIHEDQLVLEGLSIHLGKSGEGNTFIPRVGPEINGRGPALAIGDFPLFDNIYDDLRLPLQFSGGLLIARNFIQELYVHMGFHPAWKFREVWELLFDKGIVKETQDVSLKVAELRQKLTRKSLWPVRTKDKLKWIQDTFRLDY